MRFATKSVLLASLLTVLVGQIGGCIVSDSLTTLTIESDGSADLVTVHSNVRSTESGPKAEQELNQFKADFDARSSQDFVRIQNAGGEIVEASWIRSVPPFSNFIHAHLTSASVVESYLTAEANGLPLITTDFKRDGSSRVLRMRLHPKPANGANNVVASADDTRQKLADGISEFRIAIAAGTITKAEGFTVAKDKQSALLDFERLTSQLGGENETEFIVEWQVSE